MFAHKNPKFQNLKGTPEEREQSQQQTMNAMIDSLLAATVRETEVACKDVKVKIDDSIAKQKQLENDVRAATQLVGTYIPPKPSSSVRTHTTTS